MPLWAKILLSLIVGLALGIALLWLALGVGGLGHGWVTPLWFSFAGPVIYPITVFRLLCWKDRWIGLDLGLVVLGILLDFAIYAQTMEEGVHFFYRVGEVAYIWIAAWALWQVALILKLAIVAIAQRGAGKLD